MKNLCEFVGEKLLLQSVCYSIAILISAFIPPPSGSNALLCYHSIIRPHPLCQCSFNPFVDGNCFATYFAHTGLPYFVCSYCTLRLGKEKIGNGILGIAR